MVLWWWYERGDAPPDYDMTRTNGLAVRACIALLLTMLLLPAVGAVLAFGGGLFATEMAVLLGVGFAGVLLAAWSVRL